MSVFFVINQHNSIRITLDLNENSTAKETSLLFMLTGTIHYAIQFVGPDDAV